MPTYSVKAPNGRIYRVQGPAGASEAQVQAEVLRQHPDATSATEKPTSFWQGFGEELMHAGANAGRMMERLNPVTGAIRAAADTYNYLVPPKRTVADVVAGREAAPRRIPLLPSTTADVIDREVQRKVDASPYRGSTAGKIAGAVFASAPTMAVPGAQGAGLATRLLSAPVTSGAVSGLLTAEDLDNPMTTARDVAIGAAGGKLGEVGGKYVLAPIAERVGRTAPVRKAAEAVAKVAKRVPLPAPPKVTSPERAVTRMAPQLANVRQNVQEAADLGLPFSLADADPRLRTLGGSVARFSPDARALAEQNYLPRARGQADRAVNAIDQHLAPVTNIEQRGKDIKQAANAASKPFYDEARAMPAPIDDQIAEMLRRPAAKDALRRAYTIAANEGRDPAELGFVLDDTGGVTLKQHLASEAGRYGKEPLGNEFKELTNRTVRGWNGQSIPKRGPIDMVGWLRLQGGLVDQAGELRHMGLTNAPRRLDFVGQEARFGPLVNPQGMNLDDAAMRAWEAGYFPQHADRPSINEFLEALRSTHEGRQRNFLPEDLPEVERFYGAQRQKFDLQNQRFDTGGTVRDKSFPADERAHPPLEAYGTERQVEYPTFETLQLVKRGLDSRLSDFRNDFGDLILEGNPEAQSINELLHQFNSRLGELNEPYKQGNAAYAKEIARRDALNLGGDVAANNVPQRQFDAAMGRQSPETLPEFQRGYATNMADVVNKQRLSRNPYDSVYGSTDQQAKVGRLFPGAPRFDRQYAIEGTMGDTLNEVLRGSQTQGRNIADQLFQSDLSNAAADAGIQTLTGGGVPGGTKLLGLALQKFKDSRQLGLLGAQKKAAALAPTLFDTSNPQAALDYIDDLARRLADEEARKGAYRRTFGLLGMPAGALAAGATSP